MIGRSFASFLGPIIARAFFAGGRGGGKETRFYATAS